MLRYPAVAGSFYEADPDRLRHTVERCFLGSYGPGVVPSPPATPARSIVGLVCPHAGYRFSGCAAACAYAELARDGLPDTAVLIGPNHHGIGPPAAVMADGTWQTPLGDVQIDSEAAHAAIRACDLLREDPRAHIPEHSLEVQLPFLQYLGADVRIVPIILSIVAWEDGEHYAENIGRALAAALEGRNAAVIASTDFTHYEPRDVAERQDRKAIERIEHMDGVGLLDVVRRNDITMCGAVPVAAAIAACSALGAARAELITYYTSGDIIVDTSQVVGYGALKMIRAAGEA